MILDLVLNPCIDKESIVEKVELNGHNKIVDLAMDIGGSGIDCAKIIKMLQSEPTVMCFLGGMTGRYIKTNLDKNRIKSSTILVNGETKLITTIIDGVNGNRTIFEEETLKVSDKDIMRFQENFTTNIKDSKVTIIDGSIEEHSSNNHLFEYIIDTCKKYNSKIVLSMAGVSIHDLMKIKPYGIQVDKEDLRELGLGGDTIRSIKKLHTLLREDNVHYLLVDLGLEGIYTLSKRKVCMIMPFDGFEPVTMKNYQGAVLAAFAVAIERKYEQEKMTKLAMAASLAAMASFDGDVLCKMSDINLFSNKLKVNEVMNQDGWFI